MSSCLTFVQISRLLYISLFVFVNYIAVKEESSCSVPIYMQLRNVRVMSKLEVN